MVGSAGGSLSLKSLPWWSVCRSDLAREVFVGQGRERHLGNSVAGALRVRSLGLRHSYPGP